MPLADGNMWKARSEFFVHLGNWQGFLAHICTIFQILNLLRKCPRGETINYRAYLSPSMRWRETYITAIQAIINEMSHKRLMMQLFENYHMPCIHSFPSQSIII